MFDVVSQMSNTKWLFEKSKIESRFAIENEKSEFAREEDGIKRLLSILEVVADSKHLILATGISHISGQSSTSSSSVSTTE